MTISTLDLCLNYLQKARKEGIKEATQNDLLAYFGPETLEEAIKSLIKFGYLKRNEQGNYRIIQLNDKQL